jgi:general secretion pathway protein K
MRGGAVAARNTMSIAQARAAADGAIERVAFELGRPRSTPDVWLPDGRVHTWADGEIAITSTAVDESALIDLNAAADPLLKGLLQQVGGLDSDTAEHVLEAILDWRDPSGLRRPNGAGPDDYRAAGLKYVPTNARFESVGELQRVLGITPELMARIAGSLTVYSQQRGINSATAPRNSLLALPGVTPDQVDAFIASRTEALANQLPIPPFPPAQAYSGTSAVWRIHVEATTPDGVTFARDAVVRPQNDVRQPMVVLLWEEGETPLRSAATDNTTQANGTSKS